MEPILSSNKNEELYKTIESDLINTVKSNTAESIEVIEEKIRNLLNYYKSIKKIATFEMTKQPIDNDTAIIIRVKDVIGNRWQYMFKSRY